MALLLSIGVASLAVSLLDQWGVLLIAAFCGVTGFWLLSCLAPELPIVILLVGMPVWGVLPEALGARFEGLWIPLTLALAVGSFGLHAVLTRRLRLAIPRPVCEDIWLMLFTGWVGLAVSWSATPSYGMFKFLGFAANVLCAYLIVRWASSARLFNLQRMAKLLIVASLIHVAVVIYIDIQIGFWGIGGVKADLLRTSALSQMGLNKIAESTAMALGILATLWFWFTGRRGKGLGRAGIGALLLLQAWGLLNYQQRGPMVGLILGIVIMVALLSKKVLHTLRKGRLGTLIVIGFLGLVILGALFYMLNPSFQASYMTQDANVISRLRYYGLGWDTFLSSPLRGIGTGGMGLEVEEGYQRVYVHNLILELLAETGIVGLGLFAALVGVVSIRLWKSATCLDIPFVANMALPAAAFVYACVMAMFSGDLSGWRAGLWVALLVSLYQQGRHRSRRGPMYSRDSGKSSSETPSGEANGGLA